MNDPGQVAVLELRSGRHHPLITGSQGEYVDSGHLVHVAQDTLRAVRFDLDTLAIAGNAVPIEQVVMKGQFGAVDFAVSRSGTLIYVPPGAVGQIGTPRSLVWVTRQGTEQPISAPPRSLASPSSFS